MMHNPLTIDDQYVDRQLAEDVYSNSQKQLDKMINLSIGSPERAGTVDSVGLDSVLT